MHDSTLQPFFLATAHITNTRAVMLQCAHQLTTSVDATMLHLSDDTELDLPGKIPGGREHCWCQDGGVLVAVGPQRQDCFPPHLVHTERGKTDDIVGIRRQPDQGMDIV